MKRSELGDLVQIIGGGTPSRNNSEFYGGDIPWVTVKDFGDRLFLWKAQESITEKGLKESATKLVPAGNVILVTRMAVGRVAINATDIAINQDLKALICKSDLDSKYLLFFLLSQKDRLESQAGGATVKGITVDAVEELEIPLPPIAEQKRIAAICAKADRLRRTRRYALELSDTYLRSVFLEMFGDPVENFKGWEIIEVSEILSKNRKGTRCGPFGSALKRHEYVDSGIPVWGIDNVNSNQFVETGSLFITSEKYKELENYTVEYEDILISRAGTVGRMCIARPEQYPSIFGTNLICVSLDKNKALPDYFTALFSYFSGRIYNLRASSDEGAYSFINTNVLQSVKIPLPPLSLQEKFAAIVQKSNRIRAQQREALRQAEHLFQTILHRAFCGEL
jgi:type I restriction enzyme S subunit